MEAFAASEIQEMLSGGATLVTVNRRLARYARYRYGQRQVGRGYMAWETPDILPYNAWLERCHEEIRLKMPPVDGKQPPLLLSPLQERLLWEQVIEASSWQTALLQSRGAAQAAMQARRLCVEWRVPIDSDPLWAQTDPAAFVEWAREFENRCRVDNWLDRARLADIVGAGLAGDYVRLPGVLVFAGFDDFSPQAEDLIRVLVSKHVKTCLQAEPGRAGRAVRTGLADAPAELRAAAKWARARRESNPGERIGVIVNGLAQNRETVCRVFEEILHPSSMTSFAVSPASIERPAFNISMGRPLSAYPLVHSALLILALMTDDPEIRIISEILLSPFIKGADRELARRARADAVMREAKQPRMSIMQMLDLMKTGAGKGAASGYICPVFCRSLDVFERICLDMPENQSPSGWCRTFSSLLEAFGWPGDNPLDSREYQVHAAWQEALARFAASGEVSGRLTPHQAVGILQQLLNESLFQPETADVGLQVMGLLEAAGDEFDAIWVTGITADMWPPPPAPNPFIPVVLQRHHDLPHATAAREIAFARTITQRLLASADEVVVSWPMVSGESPLMPSSLIDPFPMVSPPDPPLNDGDYRYLLAASGILEDFADVKGPPVEKGGKVPGGTGIIKAQAACPFSAFVRYRLGAKPLEFPVSGIDAADRGSLLHKVLERVWRDLGSHKGLTAKNASTLAVLVSEAVSKAVSDMAKARPRTFTGRFAGMERQRLADLVMQWLMHDAARAPFDVVGAEWRLSVSLGDIRLDTFADRIDRLENNGQVVIDYKTGDVSRQDWFADRIAEPQLPLYCLALAEIPAGVFFARVKKGDMRYIGIADAASIVDGVKAVADDGRLNERFGSVADVVEYWKTALAAIADEVARGHAPVSPVSVNKTCRYCPLGMVCRISELMESGLVNPPG